MFTPFLKDIQVDENNKQEKITSSAAHCFTSCVQVMCIVKSSCGLGLGAM